MIYEYRDWVDIDVEVEGDGDVRFSAPFAQFDKPVRMANCTINQLDFHKGTNLLGNVGTPVEASFDTPPSFDGVEGCLEVNTYQPHNDQS